MPVGPSALGPYPVGYGGWGAERAVDAALRRPWQVTVLGWWNIIGSVVGLLASAALLALTLTDQSVYYDYGFYDSWLHGSGVVFLVFDTVAVVITALNLWAGIAFLRGRRGAYIYFTVILIINLVTVLAFIVLTVLSVALGGLMFSTLVTAG